MTGMPRVFDLAAGVKEPVTLQPGDIKLIPCGFAMAIPHGYEAQVRPRSGLASKHGITMVNAPGTIDSDYRGEVQVPLINLGRDAFLIERPGIAGSRRCRYCRYRRWRLWKWRRLDETKRGKKGF